MEKMFKYLVYAAMVIAFSAFGMQRDSAVAADEIDTFKEIKALCHECTQYQHTAYENQNDFAIAGSSCTYSSNLRLQNTGKRTGNGGTRFTSGIMKQSKTIAQEVRFAHSYFRHSVTINFTRPESLLIRLGRLII